MGLPFECDFGLQMYVSKLEDTTKDQKILETIKSWRDNIARNGNALMVFPANSNCIVFTKNTPKHEHIDMIRNKAGYVGKLVFINQKL